LLDKASQALVLNFIESLLKKLPQKHLPNDPYGNKAWKAKLRKEVSAWPEEHVKTWEDNLHKLDDWKPQTW
jgi:hypothetical protein